MIFLPADGSAYPTPLELSAVPWGSLVLASACPRGNSDSAQLYGKADRHPGSSRRMSITLDRLMMIINRLGSRLEIKVQVRPVATTHGTRA